MSHLYIRTNSEDVIFELIDDEIIILNLRDGNYYSLDGLGRTIWDLIIESGQTNRIINDVYKAFHEKIDRETVQEAITEFIDELFNAGLIVHIEPGMEDQSKKDIHIEPASEGFSRPVLHSYKALQDKFKHPAGIKRSDE